MLGLLSRPYLYSLNLSQNAEKTLFLAVILLLHRGRPIAAYLSRCIAYLHQPNSQTLAVVRENLGYLLDEMTTAWQYLWPASTGATGLYDLQSATMVGECLFVTNVTGYTAVSTSENIYSRSQAPITKEGAALVYEPATLTVLSIGGVFGQRELDSVESHSLVSGLWTIRQPLPLSRGIVQTAIYREAVYILYALKIEVLGTLDFQYRTFTLHVPLCHNSLLMQNTGGLLFFSSSFATKVTRIKHDSH